MNRTGMLTAGIASVWLAAIGGMAISAQNSAESKYTVRVPGGLAFSEFIDRFGHPDWERDPHAITFPGGETVAEFHHRVGRALSRIVHEHAGGAIVVVCHGGVVDVAFRALLGLPMTGGFELHTVNSSLTELVHGRPGRWRLVRYNDAAHLAKLPIETPRVLS